MRAIAAHLERLRRPAAGLLQPGLPPERIARVESKLPFELGTELLALYSTVNGTDAKAGPTLSDLWLFPGYYLLSLEEAAAEYRRMRKAPHWKASWFPVFANGAGDYYAVACGRSASRGVIGFLRGEPDQEVEYLSLDAMFKTLAACFAKGAFFVRRKEFDIDDDEHARIARRLNRGLAAWDEDEEDPAELERRARAQKIALDAHRLLMRRKPREALAAYEKAMELDEFHLSFYVNALYALIRANEKRRVDPVRMRGMLERVLSRKPLHGDTFWNGACGWMALGEVDKCIECLRQAKRRGVDMKRCLADKTFRPLAGAKRFMALKRSVEGPSKIAR